MPGTDETIDQLGSDRICALEGPEVQEVVVAPVGGLLVLLESMEHIEHRQVVSCTVHVTIKKQIRCTLGQIHKQQNGALYEYRLGLDFKVPL